MKIVAICGAGIGSSGILKVNAERVLQRCVVVAARLHIARSGQERR